MKKIKSKLALGAVLVAFALMAAGSGSDSSAASSAKQITTDSAAASADSAAPAEAAPAEATADVTIEQQVLLDHDGVVITATGYTKDPIWGEGISLLIENNSDKNIGVNCNAVIVNNYMISDSLFSSSTAAGKKANETLYFSKTDLEAAGITSVGQVELYFHLYDSDSYDALYDADLVTVQTSAYAEMNPVPQDDGTELYNQGGIRIVGKYVDENSLWGTAVLLYIENTSGANVGISCDNMSINDFMVTPFFSCTVYDGKMAVDDITILSSDLESNGITSVDNIELSFHIYDADSYSTIADSDAITFSAK